MKLRELIEELEKYLEVNPDLEVCLHDDMGYSTIDYISFKYGEDEKYIPQGDSGKLERMVKAPFIAVHHDR